MSSEKVEVVRRLLVAFNRGDRVALDELDARAELQDEPRIPGAGWNYGHDGAVHWARNFARRSASCRSRSPIPRRPAAPWSPTGERRGRASAAGPGSRWRATACSTSRGGKVRRVEFFESRRGAIEAALAKDTVSVVCEWSHRRTSPFAVPCQVRRASLVTPSLPPGPRQPQALQTIGWWTRPISFLEANRRRYGKRFTMRLLQTPPFVMLSDPDEIREVFTAPPEVLHPGEGARDPRAGDRQQLGDPARRGRAPGAAQAHAARVPRREDAAPLRAHGRGGRARGRRTGRATEPVRAPPAAPGADPRGHPAGRVRARPRPPARRDPRAAHRRSSRSAPGRSGCSRSCRSSSAAAGPGPRFLRLREETDELLFELIDERRERRRRARRRAGDALAARHEDGSPMSDRSSATS